MVAGVGADGGERGTLFFRDGRGEPKDEDGPLSNQDDGREVGRENESGEEKDEEEESKEFIDGVVIVCGVVCGVVGGDRVGGDNGRSGG